jgi:hypothetical protein
MHTVMEDRYGREIDPRTPAVYDLMADAYLAQGGRGRAAVTLPSKTLLLGAAATLGRLAQAYGDGSGAMEEAAGGYGSMKPARRWSGICARRRPI